MKDDNNLINLYIMHKLKERLTVPLRLMYFSFMAVIISIPILFITKWGVIIFGISQLTSLCSIGYVVFLVKNNFLKIKAELEYDSNPYRKMKNDPKFYEEYKHLFDQ